MTQFGEAEFGDAEFGENTGSEKITDIQVTPVDFDSVNVTWTTTVASSSQVQYGPTAGPPYAASTTLDPTQVTSHSVDIDGLSPGTSYHFRVLSWVIP